MSVAPSATADRCQSSITHSSLDLVSPQGWSRRQHSHTHDEVHSRTFFPPVFLLRIIGRGDINIDIDIDVHAHASLWCNLFARAVMYVYTLLSTCACCTTNLTESYVRIRRVFLSGTYQPKYRSICVQQKKSGTEIFRAWRAISHGFKISFSTLHSCALVELLSWIRICVCIFLPSKSLYKYRICYRISLLQINWEKKVLSTPSVYT